MEEAIDKRPISVKCIIAGCIDNPRGSHLIEMEQSVPSSEVISQTVEYLCLASSSREVKKIVCWLQGLYGVEETKKQLKEAILAHKIGSSRTARILLSALILIQALRDLSVKEIESFFAKLSLKDLFLLPTSSCEVVIDGEPSLDKIKMSSFFGKTLPSGFLAKWLGEFKGTVEELEEALEFVSQPDMGNAALKAAIERMLLRSSINACMVVQKLKVLDMVTGQFLPLLSSETDATRTAALHALKANKAESVVKSLVTAFNAKGVSVKVKVTLADAIAQSQSKEAKDLAAAVVAKETNEQIVGFLLPLVADKVESFASFKTAKAPLKTVLVSHMGNMIVKEYAQTIYELVLKEATPTSTETFQFACAALGKLSSVEGLDWTKFIKDADAKPTSLLRQIGQMNQECQNYLVDWLLSIPKSDPTAAKAIGTIALSGHSHARKRLHVKLGQLKTHHLDLEVLSEMLDDSVNSWKLCKTLVKTEADVVALFGACHRIGHDWILLATRISPSVTDMVAAHFEDLFAKNSKEKSSLETLVRFAPSLVEAKAKEHIQTALKAIENSDLATDEKINAHQDATTLAIPVVMPKTSAKPDHKAEKTLQEQRLAEEKARRHFIEQTLASLSQCTLLAKVASCEEFAPRCAKLIQSGIYGKSIVELLYAMAKQWRPLVASVLVRHALGDASPMVCRNWNISSISVMEESIKRLFCHTKACASTILYVSPLLVIWLKNGQFDFIPHYASAVESLDAPSLELVKKNRAGLVQAFLSFDNRTLDVDRVMTLLGGPITDKGEAQLFLDALFSECLDHRRTALEALHTSWSLDPAFLSSELIKRFIMVVDLLKYEDACMQVATVVSLKLAEINLPIKGSESEEAVALCQLLETVSADSWIGEAAKEAIAALPGTVAITALLASYARLLKDRRPEVVNVRSAGLDLTKVNRASIVESLGMVTLPSDQPTALLSLFQTMVLELFFDPAPECFETALQSALALLESIPAERMEKIGSQLGNLFESFLANKIKPSAVHTVEETDRARVFVIILLGKVSQFMSQDADRRKSLVTTMLETLKTPAENVQCAVAEALVPLFSSPHHQKACGQWISSLKTSLYEGSMASRRGAAYGIAALTKARGLTAVKEWDLMSLFLTPFRQNLPKTEPKPTTESKEGALFGLELVAKFLGPAFEPYVMKTIDAVLTGFSDGKAEVREATFDTARSLMTCVSSAGARLLLPALLSRATLEGANWRSRVGVLEWLGAMASMAPSVLAARLPEIIPVLIETGLNDSHGQVQAAARKSLIQYGKAVVNPEMRSLVPSILEALADPSVGTVPCFKRILNTRFYHIIDGPSLALLEPLLRRALIDRSAGAATLKKLAGQIIGNLATNLVDAMDFGPYLSLLVPALCGCLGDPVPQVRAHAAKVIGMLVKVAELDGRKVTLGVVSGLFPALQTQLLTSNEAHTNDIDRAGAAQALAEIMAAKGIVFAGSILEEKIVPFMRSSDTLEREGSLLILGYLPSAFDFYEQLPALYTETIMPKLIGSVLAMAADPAESVRDSAVKTSKSLVEQFVSAGIDRDGIFAALLDGFGSPKWRVRLACLSMLEKAMTTYDQAEGDEDDSEEADNVIKVARLPTAEELISTGVLDKESIQILQTRLFLSRFDPSSSHIRSTALNLWKALSYHSPRTLTEILPLLVRECAKPATIDESTEQVQRALEDFFSKLGDRLALPFLEQSIALFHQDDTVCRASILSNAVELVKVMGNQSDLMTRLNTEETIKRIVGLISAGLQCADNADSAEGESDEEESGTDNETEDEDSEEDSEISSTQEWASRLFDTLLSEVLYSAEQSAPVIRQIVRSEGFSNDALLLLIEYKPAQMLSVVIPTILDALPDPEQLELLGAVFDTAGNDAASHAIPVAKKLLGLYAQDMDNEDLQDTLRSVLSSINVQAESEYSDDSDDDDYGQQDTVFHLRLGQLLEFQLENGLPGAAWAYLLLRLYCEGSPDLDHSRLYGIWVPRLLTACFTAQAETREDAAQAKPALLALLGAPRSSHLGSLVQTLRVPASRLERAKLSPLSAWHTPLLTHLTKTVLLPVLTATSTSSDTDMAKCFACEIAISFLRLSSTAAAASSWGTSALTLLVGALIRVGSDRKATDARTTAFHALLEALKIHPTALRPFFPQLQRLLSTALTSLTDASSSDMDSFVVDARARLLPLLPKPEALLQDWAAILAVAEDESASAITEDNIQRVSAHAKTAMLMSLSQAFSSSTDLGAKVAHLKEPLVELLKMLAAHPQESVRLQNSRFIDALASASVLSPTERKALLDLAEMLK